MSLPCKWDTEIGRILEFISESKGLKATMFTISVAVLLQVGTFLFLWGGLTTTVATHEKNINRVLSKLDSIKLIGYVNAEEVK
jgi:hypothetical protein